MKTAEKIMTKNPCSCIPETPLEDVARLMVEHDCGEIPVVDDLRNLRIMGVITDRDIVCRTIAKGTNPLGVRVADVMTFPPVTVSPDASVDLCCELMERHRIRRIPVVDDYDRLCGIIAQADIVNRAGNQMSEVLRRVSAPNDRASSSLQAN